MVSRSVTLSQQTQTLQCLWLAARIAGHRSLVRTVTTRARSVVDDFFLGEGYGRGALRSYYKRRQPFVIKSNIIFLGWA